MIWLARRWGWAGRDVSEVCGRGKREGKVPLMVGRRVVLLEGFGSARVLVRKRMVGMKDFMSKVWDRTRGILKARAEIKGRSAVTKKRKW